LACLIWSTLAVRMCVIRFGWWNYGLFPVRILISWRVYVLIPSVVHKHLRFQCFLNCVTL
jgi:hypothetical protein